MEWTSDIAYRALEAAQRDFSFDPEAYRYYQHLMDKEDDIEELKRQLEMEDDAGRNL